MGDESKDGLVDEKESAEGERWESEITGKGLLPNIMEEGG